MAHYFQHAKPRQLGGVFLYLYKIPYWSASRGAFLWAPYMSNTCSDKHTSVQHESHQTKILVTVASAVIAALLLWIGGTVSNNQVSLATLQADMLNLRVDIQEAADRSDDFRKEYNSDKRDLEKRLRALESQ